MPKDEERKELTQEEIDARHFIHRRLQTGDDFLHPVISFIQWFEIDL